MGFAMETAVRLDPSVRFGSFQLDLRTGELYRKGSRLKLRGHPIDVLKMLIEHAGELVTREALQKQLWPDNTFVDFEQILNNSIVKLREALSDQADSPRFIETLPRLGYRFICPIESGDVLPKLATRRTPPDASRAEAAGSRESEERRPKLLRVVLAATGVALLGAAGLTWFVLRPLPTLRIVSYTQITNVHQRIGIAGTDGSGIYVNLFLPGGIGVVPGSGGRVVPLFVDLPTSKDSPNDAPVIVNVSPDGSRLLVASDLDPSSGRKLWVVNSRGGGARYLADGIDAEWSPDGQMVVYSTLHGDLFSIPTDGGEPRLLLASPATPEVHLEVAGLAWSPDGKRIRFARNNRYWEVSADGRNPHEILPNWHRRNPEYNMCCGRWTPDGDFFLFNAGFAGSSQDPAAARQLWALDERRSWLHRANPEPVQLTTPAMTWGRPAFSRDGKTVYSTGMTLKGELVRYDATSKQLLPYLGGISARDVAFSSDGRFLVYIAHPEGTMWRANRDGTGTQQLTSRSVRPSAPKWSPDGRRIVFFESGPDGPGEMYSISSQGGMPKPLLPGDKGWQQIPGDWSPDGTKIVFGQSPVGTVLGIFQGAKSRVLDLGTEKFTNLPPCPKPCYSPQWSPDGRYILELATDHKNLLLLDLRTNRWSQLTPNLGAIGISYWSHDGRSIYFEDNDVAGVFRSTDPGIYRIPVSGGRAEKVVDLRGFRGTGTTLVGWSGLDPEDAPLLLRDAGTCDIYALGLERK